MKFHLIIGNVINPTDSYFSEGLAATTKQIFRYVSPKVGLRSSIRCMSWSNFDRRGAEKLKKPSEFHGRKRWRHLGKRPKFNVYWEKLMMNSLNFWGFTPCSDRKIACGVLDLLFSIFIDPLSIGKTI